MKLSWDGYAEKIGQLHESWRLAIRAIKGFIENDTAFDSYLFEDYNDFIKILTETAELNGKNITDFPSYQLYDDFKVSRAPYRKDQIEEIIEHINSSFYITFFAVLEDQLKMAIRVLLWDNPTILDSQRTVPLGKLLMEGYEKVVSDEIERQIAILDRKNIGERLNFMNSTFGIDLFGEPGIYFVNKLNNKRNELLHEKPGIGITSSETTEAFFFAFAIGSLLILFIDAINPDLILGSNHTEEDRKKFINDFPGLQIYIQERKNTLTRLKQHISNIIPTEK